MSLKSEEYFNPLHSRQKTPQWQDELQPFTDGGLFFYEWVNSHPNPASEPNLTFSAREGWRAYD
ncbi:hypothetical protein CVT26_010587 [Gymnopilus dilepis]|uniref:Uncharacterized protein n=1 Tax=Gymnopilus dilepis TaxID=231916 RepID=A0A409VZI5_9AGAR|nr:hypothetical protein CVT26_010587 [Gymnopilus dilepis]